MVSDQIEKAVADIHKKYGKTAVMRLGDRPEMDIEAISTGNIAIDLALGIGGLPKGRVVEIFGPESSGKSTLTLQVIAEAQKEGGNVAFIDSEHALDPTYANALGVNCDEMWISQPDHGEQALEIALDLIKSGGFAVVVVDSVAALTPLSEIKGEIGDSNVGKQPRMMSQALRMLTPAVNNSKTLLIFTNQIREKIGVMFGSPEVTPGGRALKFYSSVRIDIRRVEQKKDGEEIFGNRSRVKIVKNKVAPPFKQAEVDLEYGIGFVAEAALLDEGVRYGIVNKSGAWYATSDGEKIGQGRENAIDWLQERPEVAKEISDAIWVAAKG